MRKTFSINTLGCKVNQYESQQIRQHLEGLGLRLVSIDKNPDLAVINTCCVTHIASAKSRQNVRKAKKLSPRSPIIVCGCLPTLNTYELNSLDEKNLYIIKNRYNLAFTLTKIALTEAPDSQKPPINLNKETTTIKAKNNGKIKEDLPNLSKLTRLTAFKGQTRAFLKVQDGCDGYCSYCIIPQARPEIYNKPLEEVLAEAKALVAAGHKEIVLTGIYLGAYGQNTVRRKKWANKSNDKLAELLDKLAEIPNLKRIRLSSLEPADVTEQLLDAFCRHSNIMPHLHLSLQSGSNAILKRMCRQYRVTDFLRTVELIRSRIDRPALTCDLIVGFPGEMDDDFEKTVKIAKEIGFAKMHIFSFSPREGTAAADMQPVVESKVVKERSKILRDFDLKLGFGFRQQFIGEEDTILTEAVNGQVKGRSSRYFYVNIKKPNNVSNNQMVRVKLVQNDKHAAIGEIANF